MSKNYTDVFTNFSSRVRCNVPYKLREDNSTAKIPPVSTLCTLKRVKHFRLYFGITIMLDSKYLLNSSILPLKCVADGLTLSQPIKRGCSEAMLLSTSLPLVKDATTFPSAKYVRLFPCLRATK